MPRIAYDPTRVALLNPGLRETVFADARYRVAGLDALCAECARLAYVDFDVPGSGMRRLAEALALVGFAAPTELIDKPTGTEAFATVTPDGRALVSFRGTQPKEIKDLLTDGKAWLVPWDVGGKVHEGFRDAFKSIEHKLAKALQRATSPLPPIFTGHSLGAALATLAASTHKGATLVTFGSPRVGDAAFVATLQGTTIHRYVDCSDFVTKLPPPFPGFYTHRDGDPLYIDRDGGIGDEIAGAGKFVDQVVANVAYLGTHALLFHRNVLVRTAADHAPINYIRAFT